MARLVDPKQNLPEEAWTALRLHLAAGGGKYARQALRELYLGYREPMLEHLSEQLSPAAAEAILHRSFLRIAEQVAQWKDAASPSAWLWTMLGNTRNDLHGAQGSEFQAGGGRLAPGSGGDGQAQWRRLLDDIDQRGLLQRPPRTSLRWALGAAGAAALLLAMGALLPALSRRASYDEPPAWRTQVHVVHKTAERPRDEARRLAGKLSAAGLAPAIYQDQRAFVVDVVVETWQLEAGAAALKAEGAIAQVGITRWEIGGPAR